MAAYGASSRRRRPSRAAHAARPESSGGILRLLISPAAAFIVLFPTIGFYTLFMAVSILSPDSSLGAVILRFGSLMILVLAFALTGRGARLPAAALLPATLFLVLYFARMLENMFISGLVIPPDNNNVLLVFLLSAILPSYLLAAMARQIRDADMTRLMSFFVMIYLFGLYFNWTALSDTSEQRATLERVNSVALAYLSSSFLLFYFVKFGSSKIVTIGALLVSPILLVVVSIARSRGMMASSGAALLIYFLLSRGSRRMVLLVCIALAVAVAFYYSDSDYVQYFLDTLGRVNSVDDKERLDLYQGSWAQIQDYPLFGRYILEMGSGFYPHNVYVEAVMAVGVIGAIPFALHIIIASYSAFGLIRNRHESAVGAFVALLFFRDAIGAAAAGSLYANAGLWISSFLVIALRQAQPARIRRRRIVSSRAPAGNAGEAAVNAAPASNPQAL